MRSEAVAEMMIYIVVSGQSLGETCPAESKRCKNNFICIIISISLAGV